MEEKKVQLAPLKIGNAKKMKTAIVKPKTSMHGLFDRDGPPDDMTDIMSLTSLDSRMRARLGYKHRHSIVEIKNQNLEKMERDYLYHLGLTKHDAEHYRDIKYLVIGGTNDRMTKFAYQIAQELGLQEKHVESVGMHKRYVIYKVGPVLVCSHGMGGPSISILLHEIGKLLKYAGADCVWLRIGTCGGLGVEGGTLVLSE